MSKLSLWLSTGERIVIFPDNCLKQYEDTGVLHRVYFRLVCPDCGKTVMVDETIEYKFCPHCGTVNIAEMKEK